MSSINTEVVPEIPGKADEVVAKVKAMSSACETISEIAKSTGAGQFVKDATKFSEVIGKLQEMVAKAIGEEGQTLGNDGTVYAAYEAGKKAAAAMGGEV